MYLDMELFGYEDLLFELARNGIKVELHEVQKRLVENLKESDLFRYDGDADLKVFARDFGKRVYTERDYRKLVIIKCGDHFKSVDHFISFHSIPCDYNRATLLIHLQAL